MQKQLRGDAAHTALSRVLEFFEAEISEASDEEVLEAAAELRMNPRMKGSIAFAGVTFSEGLRHSLFSGFDADALAALPYSRFDREQLAALQRKLRSAKESGDFEAWPDHGDLTAWLALIRQLRGK